MNRPVAAGALAAVEQRLDFDLQLLAALLRGRRGAGARFYEWDDSEVCERVRDSKLD